MPRAPVGVALVSVAGSTVEASDGAAGGADATISAAPVGRDAGDPGKLAGAVKDGLGKCLVPHGEAATAASTAWALWPCWRATRMPVYAGAGCPPGARVSRVAVSPLR